MRSRGRLEYQSKDVQLFCRGYGSPQPEIKWLDTNGTLIESSEKYTVRILILIFTEIFILENTCSSLFYRKIWLLKGFGKNKNDNG